MDADTPSAPPASTNPLLARLPVWGLVNRGAYGAGGNSQQPRSQNNHQQPNVQPPGLRNSQC